MKVKAKTGFSGLVTMAQGDVREIADEAVVKDLIRAGYVEEVKEKKPKKKKGDKK